MGVSAAMSVYPVCVVLRVGTVGSFDHMHTDRGLLPLMQSLKAGLWALRGLLESHVVLLFQSLLISA